MKQSKSIKYNKNYMKRNFSFLQYVWQLLKFVVVVVIAKRNKKTITITKAAI